MTHANTGTARWRQLDGKRRGFITRCELYASYTLRKICLPDNYESNNADLQHDNQAVGAQSVNHLSNKIMLALFAPSRPFFRMDPSFMLEQELKQSQIDIAEISMQLAQGEKQAIRAMDRMALRPKLYEAIKHLIITGNVLVEFLEDGLRVLGVKNYVVRRSKSGLILELLIRDKMEFGELSEEVREECKRQGLHKKDDDTVEHIRWYQWTVGGDYKMSQHVESIRLSKKFDGKYPEDRLPVRCMTWDLADGFDYGTGLVEDYKGDFAGLSMLSRAQIEGAVLASEFRWLVNPAGMTEVMDFQNAENGAAIPGVQGDITLLQSGKAADLAVIKDMAAEYINRIGRGFLLGSAITRDAERVTAEEIRMQAQELETSLGGAYSRLAVDFQIPMAYWLLDMIDMDIRGSDIEASIVTGLDALSRGNELENLQLFIQDVAALATIPPDVRARIKMGPIINAFAAGRRVTGNDFVMNDQEWNAEQQRMQAMQLQSQAQEAGVQVAADAAANGAI